MPVRVLQFVNPEGKAAWKVGPLDDARLYNHILRVDTMIKPCTASIASSFEIHITEGLGIAKGHLFGPEDEVIGVQLAASGTMKGRIVADINLLNPEQPGDYLVQVETTLPALIQEDLLNGGSRFQAPMFTFDVTTAGISNLRNVQMSAEQLAYKGTTDNLQTQVAAAQASATAAQGTATTALTRANAAVPKTTLKSTFSNLGSVGLSAGLWGSGQVSDAQSLWNQLTNTFEAFNNQIADIYNKLNSIT